MEGFPDEEIAVRFREFKERQAAMTEDLLSGRRMCGRCDPQGRPGLERLAESGHERIAVVTHGGVIRTMAAWYLGMPLEKWRLLGKDLENTSITQLKWDRGHRRFTLERFNDYAHLEACPEL